MLSNRFSFIFYVLFFAVFFPGCIKYYKLSKTEFPQGKDHPTKEEVTEENLKDVAIFDQFETKARFNLLYLSDDVRSAYVDMSCLKKGKDDASKEALLARQLEENRHWITFYILADIRDKTHLSLTDKNSSWSFYLKLKDDEKVAPIGIKEVEMEPEYQSLFGHRFNLFKRIYLIKFPATDLTGNKYLKDVSDFKMVISSAYKSKNISWDLKKEVGTTNGKKRKILKDEDFYWL